MSGMKNILRALRHRNYRLFFAGQGVSLVGTWMQRVAVSWLVYRLSHSVMLLGIVGFAGQLPTFLLAPLAGAIADRSNRYRFIIVLQALEMVQAFVLAFLVLTGAIQVWHIIALSIFLGVVSSFEIPMRQSFIIDMLEDRGDLGNAIALNSSLVNGARLLGPTVAGVLIAAAGEGMCFLVNGISYMAVLAALLAMRIKKKERKGKAPKNVLQSVREGFSYAFGFPPIKAVLLLLAVVNLVGMPFRMLLPVFAARILHGGANTLGFLTGATGAGALAGAVYLASRKSVIGLGRIIVVSSCIFGASLMLFALSENVWVSLGLMAMTGFGMMVQMAASNTVLQTIVEDDKRGRIMSFFTMSFMGMAPFGSLLAGSVANRIGAPDTVLIGGLCSIAAALLFAGRLPLIREQVRPLYESKGIIAK
ncbi:MAG: MFS transporter [Nitrospiraceae bacterium]|nr:MFS transporter [Nitrospiraceae bacterium]